MFELLEGQISEAQKRHAAAVSIKRPFLFGDEPCYVPLPTTAMRLITSGIDPVAIYLERLKLRVIGGGVLSWRLFPLYGSW